MRLRFSFFVYSIQIKGLLMKKTTLLSLILAILVLSGCALFKPKLNENFKRDDLTPALADSVDLFIGEVYRMKPEYTNELIVAIIRANTLNVENARVYYPTLINLISLKNRNYLDENWIMSHLEEKEQKDFQRVFPTGFPVQQSISKFIQGSEFFMDSVTCEGEDIDAHWAYFSATGDTKVIEKIEKTMSVYNRQCCFECLQNTLLFRSIKNKDVYDKLVEIRDKKCAKAPNPAGCAEYYNNRYIPPREQCDWSNLKEY